MSGATFGGTIKLEGAVEYKRNIQNINSKLKLLSKEMEVNGKSAENFAKLTDACSRKVTEQKKHIEELEKALEKARKQYGNNSDEVIRLETKLNDAKAALLNMKKELDDLQNKFKQTALKLADAGSKMTALGDKLSGLSTAAGATVAAMTGLAIKSAASADSLMTLSEVTGVSTDELQKFAYASEQIDVSTETFTSSLAKLVKNMQSAQNTAGTQRKSFEELGVSFQNADGSLRNNLDVFYDVIDALGKVGNETEADALAMNLFGKSAMELNPLIKQGSDTLKEFGREAEEAGLILDNSTLETLGELDDAIQRFRATATAEMSKLGADIAPVITPLFKDATAAIEKVIDKLAQLDTKDIETGLKIAALVAALAPLLKTLGNVTNALSTVVGAAGKLSTAFTTLAATQPALAATIAALAALNAAFALLNATIKDGEPILNDFNNKVLETSKEYERAKRSIDDKTSSQQAEYSTIQRLLPRLDELSTKTDRTAEENAELEQIIGTLNRTFPDLGIAIDDTTGKLNTQTDAIYNLIEAQKKEIETAAYYEKMQAAIKNSISAQENTVAAKSTIEQTYAALNDKEKKALYYIQKAYKDGNYLPADINKAIDQYALWNNLELKDIDVLKKSSRVSAYQAALQSGQLTENREAIANLEIENAQKAYQQKLEEYEKLVSKNKLPQKDNGVNSNPPQVSNTSDLEERVKKGIKTWEYQYQAGIITEEEYLKQLERIRDQYFVKDSDAWREYNLKVIGLRRSIEKETTGESAAVASAAVKSTAEILEDAKKDVETAKKSFQKAQEHSYNWISERVYKGDFADFGTTANESYERIYQRAREAFNAGILSIDDLASEVDRIAAAKLNDYKLEKEKIQNFIDDRNFYNDWEQYSTTEEKMYQKMLDNADKYYKDRVLMYKDYEAEIRDISKNVYSAQISEREALATATQDRIQRQLDQKRAEIDSQIAALNQQVSDLRSSYTTQDRQKRLAELREEISDFQSAVTNNGQEHLQNLVDERERLLREQELEDLQKKNNAIIERLEAEYNAMELEKNNLLSDIAANTAELAILKELINNMGAAISTAVSVGVQKVMNDNSIQNYNNNNNVTMNNTIKENVDLQGFFSPIIRALRS